MYRMATHAKAITARPPTTPPAITPVLSLLEEEEEVLSGAEVADGAALGVFEGDAPVCDARVGFAEASDVTLEDDSAVVVAARCQLPTPERTGIDIPSYTVVLISLCLPVQSQ
jgi:hypothetical protein